jgi:hypothetical protein
MSEQNYPTSGPDGTVPVNDAITWAANWRTYLAASGQAFNVQLFDIPIIDFKNILQYNPDAESVRAYIGLESATDPATAKLLLVPVVDGNDVLHIDTESNGGLQSGNSSNIYDLTNACPPTCGTTDVGSPLYG